MVVRCALRRYLSDAAKATLQECCCYSTHRACRPGYVTMQQTPAGITVGSKAPSSLLQPASISVLRDLFCRLLFRVSADTGRHCVSFRLFTHLYACMEKWGRKPRSFWARPQLVLCCRRENVHYVFTSQDQILICICCMWGMKHAFIYCSDWSRCRGGRPRVAIALTLACNRPSCESSTFCHKFKTNASTLGLL